MKKINSRLAPTPSGFLHLGNAYNFILTWLMVRDSRGHLTLRIDDLDSSRVRDEYILDIFESLKWLNLNWDFGPRNIADFKNNFSQSFRLDLYQDFIDFLKLEKNCYYCSCSRKELMNFKLNGKKYCDCKFSNKSSLNSALRVECPGHIDSFLDFKINLKENMGDFVIIKKDQKPSYQVTSIVDDLEAGVNLIIRGEDLISSSAAQVFLSKNYKQDKFKKIRIIHHKLLIDEQGKKLSKSRGVTSLRKLREKNNSPVEIYKSFLNFFNIQYSHEIKNIDDLLHKEIIEQLHRVLKS